MSPLLSRLIFFASFSVASAMLSPWPSVAQASADAAAQPGFAEVITKMVPLFVIVFFIFYFLVVRPQERKLRAQQQLVNNLKNGSQVITSGGVIGRVAGTGEDHILLEVGNNTRIKFEKSHIISAYEPAKKSGKEKSAA